MSGARVAYKLTKDFGRITAPHLEYKTTHFDGDAHTMQSTHHFRLKSKI